MHSYSSIVMKKDGTLWGCGRNEYGQLGLGHKNNVLNFTQLPIRDVEYFYTGLELSVFMKKDGSLWMCGRNNTGQLGLGHTNEVLTPEKVPISDIKAVPCGYYHVVVLKKDGTLWGWGQNSYGQLGLGHKNNVMTPTQIPLENVENISGGSGHTIFLKKDGIAWGCGLNSAGQLGLGHKVDCNTPTKLNISNVKSVAGGGYYTIFLKNDGTVWGCGYNAAGNLGLGHKNEVLIPTQIAIDNIQAFYNGSYYNVVMKNNGTFWGWGNNDLGQLGLGHNDNVPTPTKLSINDVEKIDCCFGHTLILKKDGTLWGSGWNIFGQLGLNDTTNRTVFTKIPIDNVSGFPGGVAEDVIHFLLSHPNGYATLDGGAVKPLEEALSKTLFETEGFGDLSQLLPVLDGMAAEFDILTYQEDQANQGIQVSHLPPPQLVIPTEDILLDNGVIAEANLVVTGQAGSVRVVISIDQGYSWQSMVGGRWEGVALSVEAIGSKGLTPDQLGAITESQWAELGGKTIRLAYYLAEGAVVDELAMTMSSINWKRAKRGKDYICAYPSKETMRVKLLADGSYKINHLAVEN